MVIINFQKEEELKFLKNRLHILSLHISKYKKDHGAKIALAKTVYKIKATTKYLKRCENKLLKC